MPDSATPQARVFERKSPWWFKLLLPLALIGPPFVPLLFFGAARSLDVDTVIDFVEQDFGPWVGIAIGGTLIGGFLALILLFGALIVIGRRRYGKCEISGDQATFHLVWIPPIDMKLAVSLGEIGHRTETPHGLILSRREKQGRFPAFLFPLFVPTHSEAENAEVVALLDSEEAKSGGEEAVTYGRKKPPALVALMAIVSVAMFLVPVIIVAARVGVDAAMGLPMLFLGVTVVIPITAFELLVVNPLYGEVAVGSTALLVRTKRFPYEDLTLLAAAPPFLAYQLGWRKKLAWLGEDLLAATARLDAALEAQGLDLRVQPAPPAWAAPTGRRRRRGLVCGAVGLFCAAVIGVCFTTPEIYQSEELCDDDGNYLRLIYRVGDGEPRFVLLMEDDRNGNAPSNYFLDDTTVVPGLWSQSFGFKDTVLVDMVEGRIEDPHGSRRLATTARLVHLRPEDGLLLTSERLPSELGEVVRRVHEVGFRPESVPGSLDPLLPGLDDDVLRDFIVGRTSRRTYDVTDGEGLRLLCGVDRGEAKLLVVAPSSLAFQVYENGFHEVAGGGKIVVRESFGRLLGDGSVLKTTAQLPNFDAMLGLVERVRGGASVRTEIEALAPDLFE